MSVSIVRNTPSIELRSHDLQHAAASPPSLGSGVANGLMISVGLWAAIVFALARWVF